MVKRTGFKDQGIQEFVRSIPAFIFLCGISAGLTGCFTFGPKVDSHSAVTQSSGIPQTSSMPSAVREVRSDPYNQQSHHVQIFVEEKLARMATHDELQTGDVDWWLDTGTERQGIRFSSPFMRMQWDLVNLRLKDKKETPIKLVTKLDSQFEKKNQASQGSMDFMNILTLVAPMLDKISYGSGSPYAAAMPQFSEVADNIQKIHQYAKGRAEIADRTSQETYIQRLNDMYRDDGFAVTPSHKDSTDLSFDKPDYTLEEVWLMGLNGPIADSVRIFSGEGQQLYKIPFHRSQVAISIFLRVKMTKGDLDLKSEKYTAVSEALNLWEGEQDEEALREFQKAFEADPKFVNGYRFRAKFFIAKGQWEEAIRDMSEAITWLRVKDRNPLYYDRGQLYWELDRIDEALKDFDRTLHSNSNEPLALTRRGFCWLEKKKLKKAASDFNAVLSQDPRNQLALTGKAWIAAMQGDYDEALRQFNPILSVMPNLTAALRGRGYCYKMLGQKGPARDDLILALKQMAESKSPLTVKKRLETQSWLKEMELEVSPMNHE